LIADQDFVIPSLKFSYFEKDKKVAVTKNTQPISITVTGGNTNTTPVPQIQKAPQSKVTITNNPQVPTPSSGIENSVLKYWYLLVGLLIGIVSTLGVLYFNRRDTTQQEIPIIKKIKKAKGDKELFDVLLGVTKEDTYISEIVEKLEENLYNKGDNKISKKEIIEHFLNLD